MTAARTLTVIACAAGPAAELTTLVKLARASGVTAVIDSAAVPFVMKTLGLSLGLRNQLDPAPFPPASRAIHELVVAGIQAGYQALH